MARPIKILHVCGSPDPGGAESFFLRLVRVLTQRHDALVLPVVRQGSWLSSRLNQSNIAHETAPFGGAFDLVTRLRLKRLMGEFKPDIAQTWMNRASRFLPRGKVVSVGRLGGYYDLKYYRGLDHLVGNTEDICRYIEKQGWPPMRVHYLPNFADMPEEGFKAKGDAIRAKYDIPDSAPVVLLAGRLHPNKGFDMALHALAQLPNHVHILLAGEGDEHENLRQLAHELGIASRVHFTGWVNAITPFCAAADIMVVSSRIEPLGNVVLEGWAHAVPVVASMATGPAQLITHGENGLLVPIDNPAAMAQAISAIMLDPALASRLGEQGLETLNTKFGETAVVSRYMDFYREITENLACAG